MQQGTTPPPPNLSHLHHTKERMADEFDLIDSTPAAVPIDPTQHVDEHVEEHVEEIEGDAVVEGENVTVHEEIVEAPKVFDKFDISPLRYEHNIVYRGEVFLLVIHNATLPSSSLALSS